MRICVCGGTNPATNPKYLGFADELGQALVDHNFDMIWGGNAFGALARVHKKYEDNKKNNTLVLPAAYIDDLDKLQIRNVIKTDTVSRRTRKMFSLADVILVIPGGIGTIYEFWSAVEYKRAHEFDIDIILYNCDNFYKHQLAHFKFINENGFTKVGVGGASYKMQPEELFKVLSTPEEVIDELRRIQKVRGLQ